MTDTGSGPAGTARPVGRREVLATLATGAGVSLAGCGGTGGTGPGNGGGGPGPTYTFLAKIQPDSVDWAIPPPPLSTLLYPPGATIRPGGEVDNQLVASTEITPDRVELTIREGVTWTDGTPVLGKDLGRWLRMFRVLGPDPAAVESGSVVPTDWRFALTSIEWDGRTLVAKAPSGLLERLSTRFEVWSFVNGKVATTPRAYFGGIWSTYTETYSEPWRSESRLENARRYLRPALHNPTIENPGLREADNVVSSGPWQIESAHVNEIRMVPHDGHPTMPEGANWPTLRIRPTNQIDKAVLAMKSGAGDAFQPKHGGINRSLNPPAHESLPDTVRAWDGKAFSGQGLLMNRKHDVLADRRVRAALAYVAENAQLATTLNRIVERPVDVQGLSGFDGSALPKTVRTPLRSYDRNTERAAELLREAGFTRRNGNWHTSGGETFELPVFKQLPELRVMRPPSPLLANAFVKQIEAFGISTQLVALEPAVAQKRFDQGDFHVVMHPWPILHANGHPYHRAAWWYASAIGFGVNRRRQLQLFDADLATLVRENEGLRWKRPQHPESSGIAVVDPKPLKQLTVEAPPVGEPEGSLEDHPVAYLAVNATTKWSWDEQKRQEALERLVWVFNYDLPHIELTRTVPQLYHDTQDWKVPGPDDPIWRYNGPAGYPSGIAGALLHGKIEAKTPGSG